MKEPISAGSASLALVCLVALQPLCFARASPSSASESQLFAENAISTGDDESHPAFTPDGTTLYFLKVREVRVVRSEWGQS